MRGRELGPREREVLEHAAAGRTVRETSFHLGLSPETVTTYRTAILHALDVPNMTAAVAVALRRELEEARAPGQAALVDAREAITRALAAIASAPDPDGEHHTPETTCPICVYVREHAGVARALSTPAAPSTPETPPQSDAEPLSVRDVYMFEAGVDEGKRLAAQQPAVPPDALRAARIEEAAWAVSTAGITTADVEYAYGDPPTGSRLFQALGYLDAALGRPNTKPPALHPNPEDPQETQP